MTEQDDIDGVGDQTGLWKRDLQRQTSRPGQGWAGQSTAKLKKRGRRALRAIDELKNMDVALVSWYSYGHWIIKAFLELGDMHSTTRQTA